MDLHFNASEAELIRRIFKCLQVSEVMRTSLQILPDGTALIEVEDNRHGVPFPRQTARVMLHPGFLLDHRPVSVGFIDMPRVYTDLMRDVRTLRLQGFHPQPHVDLAPRFPQHAPYPKWVRFRARIFGHLVSMWRQALAENVAPALGEDRFTIQVSVNVTATAERPSSSVTFSVFGLVTEFYSLQRQHWKHYSRSDLGPNDTRYELEFQLTDQQLCDVFLGNALGSVSIYFGSEDRSPLLAAAGRPPLLGAPNEDERFMIGFTGIERLGNWGGIEF